jgi:SAM-dependent methyltransferase
MRRDVLELRAFYATPLGRAARTMLARKVDEAWGSTRGLDVLGLGYATPFLDSARDAGAPGRRRHAGDAGRRGLAHRRRNQACLVEETALPLPNAMFDRVLAVHALEEADDPAALLAEIGRVMAPTGRLIVAVASRDGVWAGAESTPFGHGRPFSRSQLERLIRDAELEPAGWTRALYAPPCRWRRMGGRVRAGGRASVAAFRRSDPDGGGQADLRRQAARPSRPGAGVRARRPVAQPGGADARAQGACS